MWDIKLPQVVLKLARLLTTRHKFVCFEVTSRVNIDYVRSSLCQARAIYTHWYIFDLIVVFWDIYHEILRTTFYQRLPVIAFFFVRKPAKIMALYAWKLIQDMFKNNLQRFTVYSNHFSKIWKYNRIRQSNTPSIFRDLEITWIKISCENLGTCCLKINSW